MSVITQVSKELKCGFNQTYGNQVSLLLIHLKVSLHIYNFCYNSTIIRLIANSYYSKVAAQIIACRTFFFLENFAINVLPLNASLTQSI